MKKIILWSNFLLYTLTTNILFVLSILVTSDAEHLQWYEIVKEVRTLTSVVVILLSLIINVLALSSMLYGDKKNLNRLFNYIALYICSFLLPVTFMGAALVNLYQEPADYMPTLLLLSAIVMTITLMLDKDTIILKWS
jgi:hypothetical protein